MALLKGQMASMQGAIARLLELPVFYKNLYPEREKGLDETREYTRDQSRSPFRQIHISGRIR